MIMDPRDREALTSPSPESILVVERVFHAPGERVWMAWTTPDLIRRWWGPAGFSAPFARVSLRVGGSYLYCMRSPQGKDYWSTGVFREIVPFERIVATDSFADEKGNVVSATSYGMSPAYPQEMLLTVTFQEKDGKTKVTLRHDGIPPGAELEGARRGWNESLDKLANLLSEGF
jgi:uncharacterized protein YndB with AHSA1/START domain